MSFISKNNCYMCISPYHLYSQFWYRNNIRHRVAGPAIIWCDGSRYWLQNGKYHRTDGPAVIYSDGTEKWHKDYILIK